MEQVDKEALKEKFQKSINKFKSNSKMTYKEIIKYLLDRIKDSRGVNPNSESEHDVLEEILYDMLRQEEKEI